MSTTVLQVFPNMYNLGFRMGSFLADLSRRDLFKTAASFPERYKEWWLNLVANDPIHVLVETSLVLVILWYMVRPNKPAALTKEKLTPKEEKELLLEWKNNLRAPLVPASDSTPPPPKVVYDVDGRLMTVDVHGTKKAVLNFATADYLGRSVQDPAKNPIKQAALQALDRYGCGSCGPRGFYGTIDVHLDLEKKFASHLQTEDAILYSDGSSTCTSTVAAFCKRGDLIVVDEAIYEPLVSGVTLSRANVKWFKHNDMDDLRRVMEQVQAYDRKINRKSNKQRRFIVVEGLYKNTGQLLPLDKIVELKNEFRYRLILDESNSFGIIGPTGKGIHELYGMKLMRDAEIITISLENAVGAIGGITTGSEEVVDHQRLSGSGYCFSASLPPFTATAAIRSIELMEEQPHVLAQLRQNVAYFYKALHNLFHTQLEDILAVMSDERSPMVLVQVANIPETEDLDKYAFLQCIADKCLEGGIAVVATLPTGVMVAQPTLRWTVSTLHTTEDMDKAVKVLGEAVDVVLSQFQESDGGKA